MKMLKVFLILSALSVALAACGAQQPFPEVSAAGSDQAAKTPVQGVSDNDFAWLVGEIREDVQGAVIVDVTGRPPNAETLDFDVAMNTHSVNLDMDLATLSTLTTNTGISVDSSVWDTSQRGHHVSGILSFPATVNGVSILDGATEITVTIRNVDAEERIFIWQAGS